jgi:type 2A phosphatase activator TIP41
MTEKMESNGGPVLHSTVPYETSLPTLPKPNTICREGFKITTQKLPISKAGPIEDMTSKLGISPPEMIFGDNFVTIEHEPSGWGITFNSFDALDRVDKSGTTRLKVAYSMEWQKARCQIPTL